MGEACGTSLLPSDVVTTRAAEPGETLRPPPWSLRGRAWILVLRRDGSAVDTAPVPDTGSHRRSRLALLLFVDYDHSDCGAYQELAYVPGRSRFADGRNHLTVGRIFVSTRASQVNGRRYWGLAKELAEFDLAYGLDGGREDRVRVRSGGSMIADLHLRKSALSLPLATRLVPVRLRTFAQRLDRQDYFFAPSASGWVSPGRLLSAELAAGMFPEIAGISVLAAAKIPRFRMTLPAARTLDVPS